MWKGKRKGMSSLSDRTVGNAHAAVAAATAKGKRIWFNLLACRPPQCPFQGAFLANKLIYSSRLRSECKKHSHPIRFPSLHRLICKQLDIWSSCFAASDSGFYHLMSLSICTKYCYTCWLLMPTLA